MPTSESGSENYLLIASGPVNYAPFLAGWQEFKDHLRKIVEDQPGWTDVKSGPWKGEMQGWCRLDRKNDAEAAYVHHAKTRGVLVHLFRTSRTNGDYRLLRCNCYPHFPGISERGHSPHRSGIEIQSVNQYVSRAAIAPVPQYTMPASSTYSYGMYAQSPAYAAAPAYSAYGAPMQYATPQMPVYSTSTSGIPVNVRGGAMLTEARGIFISNLSYKIGPNDLNALLCQVGRPVDFKLHRDARTGQFKGSATAKFSSQQEAMVAVSALNQREHMGMRINARLDTDRTVVGQIEPVIVNGSNFSGSG